MNDTLDLDSSHDAASSNADEAASSGDLLFQLPSTLAARLLTCPAAGKGVHKWLYGTACKLHQHLESEEAMADLLEKAVSKCGRLVSKKEIVDAIRNSDPAVRKSTSTAERPWPEVNQEMISNIAKSGPNLAQLEEMSRVGFPADRAHADEVIDQLFPNNPLLCVGRTQHVCDTKPRSEWRGALGVRQFIVPSPMSKVQGLTKNGETSKRCLDNTGPRWYLVVEADPIKWETLSDTERDRFGCEEAYYSLKRDEQAAVLAHLARFAPLTLVVHTGGKSLHGWFFCRGQDEEHLRKFMTFAVLLGADSSSWTKCQFARLPGGLRDNGKIQRAVYFNPATLTHND